MHVHLVQFSEVFTAATGGVWRTSSVASWTDGTDLTALEI